MDVENGPYREGELLAGKYRIEGVLGSGGMAVVYAARHELLAQDVALKVIHTESGKSSELVERFINEARAVARLKSVHVVRVMDVGVLEDGSPFIVMERLVGKDLANLSSGGGRMPVELVVDYVLQALEALAEAHACGIVHRDLKPANLFVAGEGEDAMVKVLDFGIFKATDGFQGPSSNQTATGVILGTPTYMAPEQIRSSRTVDARADVWSVGVILYELLAGVSPFEGDTVGAMFSSILDQTPRPLDERRFDVPNGLWLAVLGCLQKDRSLRFASVGAVAGALLPFASPRGAKSVSRVRETASRRPSSDASGALASVALRNDDLPSRPSDGLLNTERSWAKSSDAASAGARGSWRWVAAFVVLLVASVSAGVAFYARVRPVASSDTASGTLPSAVPAASPGAKSGAGPARFPYDPLLGVAPSAVSNAGPAPPRPPTSPSNPRAKPHAAARQGAPANLPSDLANERQW